MELKVLILFANTFVNLGLGGIVWIRGASDQLRKVFIVFSVAIALWSFGLAMFFSSHNIVTELFWARALYFAGSLIAASLCFFSFMFPTPYLKEKFSFVKWGIIFSSILIFVCTLATDLVIKGVIDKADKGLIYNWGYWLWLLHFGLFMLISFINFIIQFRRSKKIERLQIKYILIGTLSAALFASVTNVILPTFSNFRYFSMGPVLTISMAGFIAYTIVKHSFMEIRLLVARAVGYSLLLGLVGIFYVAIAFTLSTLFLGLTTNSNQLVLYAILTVIIALSFESFRLLIEKVTNNFFFKGHYDFNQLLSNLSHIMSTNIELRPLVDKTLQTILKEMRIAKGALILKAEGDCYQVISEGFSEPLNTFNCHFTFLLDLHKIVIFDDLEEGELKESMRTLDISVAKVLHVNNDVIGFLILGDKASGEMYSEQDLKVFDILSPELSVAIQNSQSYEKIRRFNITLGEEVKKATADLQIANVRLKELDRLKNDFVSIASHELRTPMTAIRSYLWMAIKRPDVKLSVKMEKYLSRAYISTERLINLVNDMLNVSRIESGSIEITPKEFDVQALTEEIVAMVLPKAGEKNIKINLVKSKIPTVFADPDKVTQVILNLLGNALKFTPVDGVVTINFFTDGKMVDISIHDSGVGISKEDLSKLFQKFGRLDNSYAAAATSGGTGLGLFISKSLVELMHGKIWGASEGTGKGATFTFSLLVLTPQILAEAEKYTKKPIGEAKQLERVNI